MANNPLVILKKLEAKLEKCLPVYIESALAHYRFDKLSKSTHLDTVEATILKKEIKQSMARTEAVFADESILEVIQQCTGLSDEQKAIALRRFYCLNETLQAERTYALKKYGRADSAPLYMMMNAGDEHITLNRYPQLPLFYKCGQENIDIGWSKMQQDKLYYRAYTRVMEKDRAGQICYS